MPLSTVVASSSGERYKHCAPGPGVSDYTLMRTKQTSTSSCRQDCDASPACVVFVMDAPEQTCYIMGPQPGFLDHDSYFKFPYFELSSE